ncbi:MAG: hypothetical protein GEU28_10455 [Dehalococcoidia bacterium]|nr:hypothetical protein [Dehalococcoidia bacterium]
MKLFAPFAAAALLAVSAVGLLAGSGSPSAPEGIILSYAEGSPTGDPESDARLSTVAAISETREAGSPTPGSGAADQPAARDNVSDDPRPERAADRGQDDAAEPEQDPGSDNSRARVADDPTVTPTATAEPTTEPTPEPTVEPTPEPTAEPTPEPTAEPTPEPTTEPAPSGNGLLDAVNARRADVGKPALQADSALTAAATAYCQVVGEYFAQSGSLSHTVGGDVGGRVSAAGFSGNSWGETLAYTANPASASLYADVAQMWWNSPGHHALLYEPSTGYANAPFTHAGAAACTVGGSGFYVINIGSY